MLTNVIPELVWTLSQPETTSPGLLVLKTSSKSGLPIAWITGHATIPQPRLPTAYFLSIQFHNYTMWVLLCAQAKELNPSILVFESRVPERGPIKALLNDGLKSNFKNFP